MCCKEMLECSFSSFRVSHTLGFGGNHCDSSSYLGVSIEPKVSINQLTLHVAGKMLPAQFQDASISSHAVTKCIAFISEARKSFFYSGLYQATRRFYI